MLSQHRKGRMEMLTGSSFKFQLFKDEDVKENINTLEPKEEESG